MQHEDRIFSLNSGMKICAAQTKPVTGDIASNIKDHLHWIEIAAANEADLVVFPELSLTGYEPTLAAALAMKPGDKKLDCFQESSDTHRLTIGVGLPVKNSRGTSISTIFFQPNVERQIYSKKYLHSDEEEYFVPGANLTGLVVADTPVALAICYELSIPEHAAEAFKNRAKVYFASVAKFHSGILQAQKRLSEIAKKHAMTVIMANAVGPADGQICAGSSSVWDNKGLQLGQLNETEEGLIWIDTTTNSIKTI